MNETEWAKTVQSLISKYIVAEYPNLGILQGANLPYAYEVVEYIDKTPKEVKPIPYQTDLLVVEKLDSGGWKPRVVVECKSNSVTTHDAITYSEKAASHKIVHPYLWYGLLIDNRKHYPLPGRLFRHGIYFDFMASWVGYDPTDIERKDLLDIIIDEVEASRNLEAMLYQSRSSNRKRYVVLHKPLRLKESTDL